MVIGPYGSPSPTARDPSSALRDVVATCIRAFYGLSACSLGTGLQDTVRAPYRFRKVHVRTPWGSLWIPYGHGNIRTCSVLQEPYGPVRCHVCLGTAVRSVVQGLTGSGEGRKCTLGLYLPS